jgi:hypothetical protein
MADELTIAASLKFEKGGVVVDLPFGQLQVDVSGTDAVHYTQTIGTSAEALSLGDITTPGYVIIVNRDPVSSVTLRPGASAADLIKLKPGEVAMFRLSSTAPSAIAYGSSAPVEVIVVED